LQHARHAGRAAVVGWHRRPLIASTNVLRLSIPADPNAWAVSADADRLPRQARPFPHIEASVLFDRNSVWSCALPFRFTPPRRSMWAPAMSTAASLQSAF